MMMNTKSESEHAHEDNLRKQLAEKCAEMLDRMTEPARDLTLSEADELIQERFHMDPNTLPRDFKIILAQEISMLRLPVSVALHPFKDWPYVVENTYIQIGVCDDIYVFDDINYAILRYKFGVDHPNELLKSRLQNWCLYGCNAHYDELSELSWPEITRRSLDAIRKTYEMGSDEQTDSKHIPLDKALRSVLEQHPKLASRSRNILVDRVNDQLGCWGHPRVATKKNIKHALSEIKKERKSC